MPEHEVSMHDLFVSPNIVIKDLKHAENSNSKEIQIRSFSDFFINDGHHCKNIFLVGEPGSGKSTFIQYFALQWSKLHLLPSPADCRGDCHREDGFQDQKTLSQIKFLFYLSLRDANLYCSYKDIIQDQLLQHIYSTAEQEQACRIVQSVLESPTTCIASDGLDEWAHPIQGSCRCLSKVKGRTPVICQPHSATIVTTSRPWRLAQLPPMDSKIEKRMDIEGTGNVDELGKKIVNVLNKEADEQLDFSQFRQCVRKQRVEHLLQTPILLLQLVCLFFDGKGIPNSRCKIYASIIDILIGRQSKQHLEGGYVTKTMLQVFSDKMNIRTFWKHFIDIAKVAFEQLFPKQGHAAVVFNSNSCNLSKESKTFALECGLLTEKKSKSFSARSSHLSFTHKSFQEFFAAIYFSEHEELFETVIEPRYQPNSEDEFRTCMNDLEQIFVFMAGINAKLAEKLSILMNSHLATIDVDRLLESFSPSFKLTQLVASGLREADSNCRHDIKLCLHYIDFHVDTSDDVDMYRRLLSMNKAQLVLLSVSCYGFKNDDGAKVHVNLNVFTDVVSIQTCTQLRHLTLDHADLGEHRLVLPDNITHVNLYNVTMTGGLSVQHCTQLQHLTLGFTDLGEHGLVLPDSITHFKLHNVTMTERLTVQPCTQLQHLRLWRMKFNDHFPQLPISITHIELYNVTITGGLSVQHCTQLQHLLIHDMKFDDHFPQLPISITHIELSDVIMTGGLSVQHYTQLQHLALQYMKFDDDFPQLPISITHLKLTVVTMNGRLKVQHYTQLQHLALELMKFDNDFPQLPNSITNIKLHRVTMQVRGVLELLEQLENLPHAVTCELDYCRVEPSSEHGQVEHRLKTSTSLQFDGYENKKYDTMFFKCWK